MFDSNYNFYKISRYLLIFLWFLLLIFFIIADLYLWIYRLNSEWLYIIWILFFVWLLPEVFIKIVNDKLNEFTEYKLNQKIADTIEWINQTDSSWKTWKEILKNLLSDNYKINDIFNLNDVYWISIKELEERFPENKYIKAKIRKLLQDLRDEQMIIFLWNWEYKLINNLWKKN